MEKHNPQSPTPEDGIILRLEMLLYFFFSYNKLLVFFYCPYPFSPYLSLFL